MPYGMSEQHFKEYSRGRVGDPPDLYLELQNAVAQALNENSLKKFSTLHIRRMKLSEVFSDDQHPMRVSANLTGDEPWPCVVATIRTGNGNDVYPVVQPFEFSDSVPVEEQARELATLIERALDCYKRAG